MPKTNKSAVLALRISSEEQDAIKEAADAHGQNVSEYVRDLVRAKVSPVASQGHRSAVTSAAANLASDDRVEWVQGSPSLRGTSPQSITMSTPRLGR